MDRNLRLEYAALFLISAVSIAYQLGVMRTFSVGSWSNFGTMVISIALLGFGLAGTMLTFLSNSVKKHADQWRQYSAIALFFTMAVSWMAAQHVPFNPVLIASDPGQLLWIGIYYLLYALPFSVTAVFIGVLFISRPEVTNRLYFWNMTGSGLGGFLVILLMYFLPSSSSSLYNARHW